MEFCSSGSIAKILKVLNKIEEPQIAAICYHVLSGKWGRHLDLLLLYLFYIYIHYNFPYRVKLFTQFEKNPSRYKRRQYIIIYGRRC